jgi:hypothetical protein
VRRFAPWLLVLVACGAPAARPAAAEPTTASPPAAAGPTPDTSPAPRAPLCQAEPYRTHGTAIGCPSLGFVSVLPGRGWSLTETVPDAPRVVLAAELAPYFHMAVMTDAESAAGARSTEAVLTDLYARAAESARAQGLALTPPERGESRPNRPTLTYEVRDLAVDGQPYRSLHVWTSAVRPDGTRLDYHVSWTGPADRFDPELPETLEATTAAFVLLDAAGNALED